MTAGPTDTPDPDRGCTPLTEVQAGYLTTLSQGDIVREIKEIPTIGPDGTVRQVATPFGVVVVSQTCDIVQANRPAVQVAPLTELRGDDAALARGGKRPRYVHVRHVSPDETDRTWFADLEFVTTVEKARIADLEFLKGLQSDNDVRQFGRAVARRYGRFAFPDEVTPWLQPLEKVVLTKSNKPNSAEGQLLDHVVELRIEAAGSWENPPYDLTLCVIVDAETLPAFAGDDMPAKPAVLERWLNPTNGNRPTSAQIAERLVKTTAPPERWWLWAELAQAWAATCSPKQPASQAVQGAVTEVVGEVIAADEFPLSRIRRSEILDLDHLSGPTPT